MQRERVDIVNVTGLDRDRQPFACSLSGKSAGGPGRFVYLQRLQVRPITAPTGCGLPFQANGGFRKQHGPRYVLWLSLPAAPIGLERRTAASGSCNQLNLQTLQDAVTSAGVQKPLVEDTTGFSMGSAPILSFFQNKTGTVVKARQTNTTQMLFREMLLTWNRISLPRNCNIWNM
ncbi:hypothetical protein UY3_03501 [Chelonia mydas]|uniref:Uncharacterized protein n=1 Tax=Chelonia mydas TaxID=8469 RepID=M7BTZ1_CHEMY|nr:hypothetical protein UY3_03501 [Chelonia mydas]